MSSLTFPSSVGVDAHDVRFKFLRMGPQPPSIPQDPPPRLLTQLRERLRTKHYSLRTEHVYVHWVRRFIIFHEKRHPVDMGAGEVTAFLNHLAVEREVAASTQNQAKSALLFLYQEVLGVDLPWLKEVVTAKTARRLPVVLTPGEVRNLLMMLSGDMHLIVSLLYGTGMRLLEGLCLRVKDVEFSRREIIVREGKGNKDRVTVLPENLIAPLQAQLAKAQRLHQADLAHGRGETSLPFALAVKYPNAGRAWGWQYVFPSPVLSVDPRTGVEGRHHLNESTVQKSVALAARRAGIANKGARGVLSPLDGL